jgi:protein-disulfide isomerase
MADQTGGSNRGAAAIVAVAILVGSLIIAFSLFGVRRELHETTARLDAIQAAVNEAKTQLAGLGGRPTPPARRPGPDPDRRYAVSTAGSPARGPDGAKVKIVEFSDFQCPFCARATPTLKQVEEKYGDQVQIVFKHLPLRIHPKAPEASAAAEAAHRQGKFWEMHDRIFANQQELSLEKYTQYAQELGLDVEKFKRDLTSDEVKKRVDADAAEAAKLEVTGTPGFFVNGRFLSGARPFEDFQKLIDEELAAVGKPAAPPKG